MIWEPFVLALVLGVIMSAGLYFAYMWPAVEPLEDGEIAAAEAPKAHAATDDATDDTTTDDMKKDDNDKDREEAGAS